MPHAALPNGLRPDSRVAALGDVHGRLDALDAALADGHTVYLHCWGGKGRTGTVVGCWLARHSLASGQAAVEGVWKLREGLQGDSPESEEQRAMVRGWQAGA